jgi:hypothetical protein
MIFDKFQTVYATKASGGASESGYDGNKAASSSVEGSSAEPTTTTTQRSTTTRTVTVESVGPSSGNVLAASATDSAADGYGSAPTSGAGTSVGPSATGCAAATTVTKTVKSTITVVRSLDYQSHNFIANIAQTASPSSTANAGSASSGSALPTLSTGSAGPYNNGTAAHPTKSKKKCASSGFLTKTKAKAMPSGYKRF